MEITSFPYTKRYDGAYIDIEMHGEDGGLVASIGTVPGKGSKVKGNYFIVGDLTIEKINGGSPGPHGSGALSGGKGGDGLVLKNNGNIIAVVAGGGGAGLKASAGDGEAYGGDGGGLVGSDGYAYAGSGHEAKGGTQTAGGIGGTPDFDYGGPGENGSFLEGGDGGNGGTRLGGGGGGAGYYGGGGGAGAYHVDMWASGGAGGSSYTAKLVNAQNLAGQSDGTLKAIITELALGSPQSIGLAW